jgi:hypothetical protein
VAQCSWAGMDEHVRDTACSRTIRGQASRLADVGIELEGDSFEIDGKDCSHGPCGHARARDAHSDRPRRRAAVPGVRQARIGGPLWMDLREVDQPVHFQKGTVDRAAFPAPLARNMQDALLSSRSSKPDRESRRICRAAVPKLSLMKRLSGARRMHRNVARVALPNPNGRYQNGDIRDSITRDCGHCACRRISAGASLALRSRRLQSVPGVRAL